MKSHFKIFFVLLFVFQSFSLSAERPVWIEQPYQNDCQEARELCAVGEGQGVLSAELSARAAIARMFQTQVKSETQVSSESSSSDSFDEGIKAEFEENVQQLVRQKTDYILEGVKLVKSYTGKESVFALVSLNKKQAAQTMAEQIERLDTKNIDLFKKKSRSALLQIEQNYKMREELHKHYRFLTGKAYPSPLSYQKVVKFKTELLKKDVTILLEVAQDVPDNLVHDIVSLLILHGYRVVKEEVKSFDYRLRIDLEMDKRHLNVKGFEKYAVSLVLKAYTQDDQQLGQINMNQVEVGRSQEQVLEKALESYQEEVKDKFYQLKLD